MTVVGFTLDKKDSSRRIPYEYDDDFQRTWCEAAELADAKLWVEADAKLNEYFGLNNGFIDCQRDSDLNAKIAIGLATVKREQKYFDIAREATFLAISNDHSGGSIDVYAHMIGDMTEGYIKAYIPIKKVGDEGEEYEKADYEKASTKSLVNVTNELLKLFRIVEEKVLDIVEYNDGLHETMWEIVEELLERKDMLDTTRRQIVEQLLDLDVYRYYKHIADDWKKKLEE